MFYFGVIIDSKSFFFLFKIIVDDCGCVCMCACVHACACMCMCVHVCVCRRGAMWSIKKSVSTQALCVVDRVE